MSRELRSFSSLGFNNLLFCVAFLITGSNRPATAFWSTLFFQLVLLAPLLVIFAVDTQHRLPSLRVDLWPLTNRRRFLLGALSFALNPLFLILFFGFLVWVGLAIALSFLTLAFVVHLIVYAVSRLPLASSPIRLPQIPVALGGIAQETWYELTSTLDFWAALVIASCGTAFRLFARAPDPEAFPILAVLVGIALSTVAQRMLSLDGGRAALRYRLLPIAGWKLLLTQDMALLIPLIGMVSLLGFRSGLAFGLVALAIGRYPSLRQQNQKQRRWRFVAGDPRFGVAQVLFGVIAGIGALRAGAWAFTAVLVLYIGSIVWGNLLWKRL